MPSFNTINLTRFVEDMQQAGRDFVTRLRSVEEGSEINIHQWFLNLSMQVITATSFGRKVSQNNREESDPLVDALPMILNESNPASSKLRFIREIFPFLDFLGGTKPSTKKAINLVLGQTADMVRSVRKGTAPESVKRAFLSLLINAEDKETGKRLSDKEVRDQTWVFMQAGYDTTGNTMTFASYLIASHPEVQRKMHEEIDRHYPEDGSAVTFSDLKKFTYVEMILKETLRLYPIAQSLRRMTYADCEVGGYRIPAGTMVQIPTYAIHRLNSSFEDPDAFRPERFDPKSSEFKKMDYYSYIPFGAGPRKCIGFRFAEEEARLSLINIFKHFSFKVSSKNPKGVKFKFRGLVLKPIGGVWLRPYARSQTRHSTTTPRADTTHHSQTVHSTHIRYERELSTAES